MNIKEMEMERMKYLIGIPVVITYNNGKSPDFGIFTEEKEDINDENKWRIVINNNARKYQENRSIDLTEIIDGNIVSKITPQ